MTTNAVELNLPDNLLHKCVIILKHWNKAKYRFIKDAILVIFILLQVGKFCLNSRFSKVEGLEVEGLDLLKYRRAPELEGGLRPKAAPPPPNFYSTDYDLT